MTFVKGVSGNPKGAPVQNKWKQDIKNYVTPEQIKTIMESIIERSEKDSKLAMWLMDQVLGKAVQRIEGTGDNGEIVIKLVKF
jgi:hypothetical protein